VLGKQSRFLLGMAGTWINFCMASIGFFPDRKTIVLTLIFFQVRTLYTASESQSAEDLFGTIAPNSSEYVCSRRSGARTDMFAIA
jgi:hypothetical protein